MPRNFASFTPGLNAPAEDAKPVTPANSPLPDGICRALYVGGSGDVTLVTREGTTVTFSGVPAGVLSVQASAVLTSTTATNIVALY